MAEIDKLQSRRRDARARPRGGARPLDRLSRRGGARGGEVLAAEGLKIGRRVSDARRRGARRPDRRARRPARLRPHRDRAGDLRRRSARRGVDPADGQGGLAAGAHRGDRAGRRLLQRGPQGGRHHSRHVGAREHHARHPAAADAHGRRRRGASARDRRALHEASRHQGVERPSRRSASSPAATSRRCCSRAGCAPTRSC